MLRTNLFFAAQILLITLLFTSCQRDSDVAFEAEDILTSTPTTNNNRTYANVDAQLWTYFQRFEEQAAARGIAINLNELELSGNLEDLPGENVGGQCTWHSNNSNHITIDAPLFEELSDLYREFIIFHELGHCVLNRDHREDAHSNGACVSLMRSGLEDCIDNYNGITRDSYINELFDPDEI